MHAIETLKARLHAAGDMKDMLNHLTKNQPEEV